MNSDTYFKSRETFTTIILTDRTKKVLEELRTTNQYLLSIGTDYMKTLYNQDFLREKIKYILKFQLLDFKEEVQYSLTKQNIFVSFLILITDTTTVNSMVDLFELYKEENRYIQDITVEPLLEEGEGYHYDPADSLIQCCCSHNVCLENAFIIKNTTTNRQLIVGCDCVLKCLPVSERSLLLAKKKNSSKYQRYMAEKKTYIRRKKEKEERDAFVKATYRECETCGNPNILRTEPSWKVNCIGCYVAKQNTNLYKGRCLIKLKN